MDWIRTRKSEPIVPARGRTLLTGSLGSVMLDEYGWQTPFYCIGLLGISWMLLMRYMLIAKHRRRNGGLSIYSDPFHEKANKLEPKASVPWLILLTKPAFWSLLVGHFCENNAFYILLSWMPTYFHENFPSAKGWVFNVVPWVITIPSSVGSGYLADVMINSGFSVTFVRKFMESIALLGTAFFLSLISFASSYYTCLTCLALAVACCGFHSSGILVNPQDIAPRHAGSVFGMMNMAGAIPGFIGVYVAGHILEATKSWNAVFGQTAVFASTERLAQGPSNGKSGCAMFPSLPPKSEHNVCGVGDSTKRANIISTLITRLNCGPNSLITNRIIATL
ncbi:hypothetical protein RRG08_002926 [Elysia crispata]|uniref:Uncharacterized protein n=1 Tax=Elysia crispata TaxID=231223 RepID=A0AAE1APD7_9GAST|nr:hypothetical protein RRG08_002926 [Elysia crispata]